MIAWSELKERKLVQWSAAYVAGAWALLEAVGLLSDTYAWPPVLMRALPLVLVVGFFAALVLAWFHGEKGAQKDSATEIGMLAALLVIAGAAVA